MPWPLPMSCQRLRSSTVPCDNRGYHATGTEITRPSVRSTVNVSSLTRTFVAAETSVSTVEEFMPAIHEELLIRHYQLLDRVDFMRSKPAAPLQSDWIKPDLCLTVISSDMYMRRFV